MRALSIAFRFRVLGGHTHVRVFTGPDPDHRASCGELTFTNREWSILADKLREQPVFQTGDTVDVEIIDVTMPPPVCRSCDHHWDHHRAQAVCSGGDGRCRCEHYWAPDKSVVDLPLV